MYKTTALLAAITGLTLVGSAHATSITILNHSFEPGTADWMSTGSVGHHTIDDGLNPRPDGSASNVWSNGGSWYQETGTAVAGDTFYTLTVDMGDRNGTGFPMNLSEIRVGVGSTFGQGYLELTGETRVQPVSGWETWTATFRSNGAPAAGNLRVDLLGGTQTQFDNVRLTTSAAPSITPGVARDIFVRNHSFESPNANNGSSFTPDGWAKTGGANGWDINGLTNHDPTPDPDDNEQIVMTNGADWFQELVGVNLEAGTTYTLTVDVGDRTDTNFPGAEIRIGTGSTFGTNLLDATVIANETPENTNASATDGWETWQSTFTAGDGVLGEALRIELVNTGGVQALFDNVRLTATPVPEPGSLALMGLGGLLVTRRRRG